MHPFTMNNPTLMDLNESGLGNFPDKEFKNNYYNYVQRRQKLRAEWNEKVNPRYKNRIQWRNKITEEKPKWNDAGSEKRKPTQSLTNRLDHI